MEDEWSSAEEDDALELACSRTANEQKQRKENFLKLGENAKGGSNKKRSPFYYFLMRKRGEIQEQLGIKILKLPDELLQRIGNQWTNLEAEELEMYRKMADDHNAIRKVVLVESKSAAPHHHDPKTLSVTNFTQGVPPLNDLELVEEMLHGMQFNEEHARFVISQLFLHWTHRKTPVILISFATYCDNPVLLPAEVSMAVFNVERGLIDNFSAIIDPLHYPEEAKEAVQEQAKKLGMPTPGFGVKGPEYAQILDSIMEFANSYCDNFYDAPLIYCMSEDIPKTEKCLNWLFNRCDTWYSCKLLPLELFLHMLTGGMLPSWVQEEAPYIHDRLATANRPPEPPSSPIVGTSSPDLSLDRPDSALSYYSVDSDTSTNNDEGVDSATEDSSNYSEKYAEKYLDKSKRKDKAGVSADDILDEIVAIVKNEGENKSGRVCYPLHAPFVAMGIFLQPRHAYDFLMQDNFGNYEELSCIYHYTRRDGIRECALAIVNRHAFSLLDVLVKIFQVERKPGVHFPELDKPKNELGRSKFMLYKGTGLYQEELALAELEKDENFKREKEESHKKIHWPSTSTSAPKYARGGNNHRGHSHRFQRRQQF